MLQDHDEEDFAYEACELQHALALRHLRRQLTLVAKDKHKRMLFSCAMPANALTLLSKWLVPSVQSQAQPAQPEALASASRMESETADSIVPARSLMQALVSEASRVEVGTVFFRLVALGLSQVKLAGPVDFSSSEIGILLLKTKEIAEQADAYHVETSGVKLPSAFVGSGESLQEVPLVCSLSCLSLAQLRSFRLWEESSSVQADPEAASTAVLATTPSQVLRIRADLPLADRSTFELVEELLAKRWQMLGGTGWLARD